MAPAPAKQQLAVLSEAVHGMATFCLCQEQPFVEPGARRESASPWGVCPMPSPRLWSPPPPSAGLALAAALTGLRPRFAHPEGFSPPQLLSDTSLQLDDHGHRRAAIT